MKSEDFVKGAEFLIRETPLKTDVPVADIFEILRNTRMTGHVTFILIQGGIRSATLTERMKNLLNGHDSK